MQYRKDRYGNELSVLGFGCLRFPKDRGKIDQAELEREIARAVDLGVNYFDTAYIYPGSEAALGQALSKLQLRDKVYIADKLPHYLIRSRDGLEKAFAEQLKRLQTDHIDYYLMHMLNDNGAWERLCHLGVVDWLAEKRRQGAIGQVGFSYHGSTEPFCKLLDAWDWDFCQIQYNYLDKHTQAGERGLQYANSKGLPVVIMEPLRGGKLVYGLPPEARRLMEDYPVQRSPAQWGLRWLWSQPEVTVVLSGMNSLAMVEENAAAADAAAAGMLTAEEDALLGKVAAAIRAATKVGCTGCGYCMPCPQGVNIPGTFAAYNRMAAEGKKLPALKEHLRATAFASTNSAAYQCIGCGKCEQHCPQHVAIRTSLKEASKALEGPIYRAAAWGIRVLHLFG